MMMQRNVPGEKVKIGLIGMNQDWAQLAGRRSLKRPGLSRGALCAQRARVKSFIQNQSLLAPHSTQLLLLLLLAPLQLLQERGTRVGRLLASTGTRCR